MVVLVMPLRSSFDKYTFSDDKQDILLAPKCLLSGQLRNQREAMTIFPAFTAVEDLPIAPPYLKRIFPHHYAWLTFMHSHKVQTMLFEQ